MVAGGAGITLFPLLALEDHPLIINKPLIAPMPERKIEFYGVKIVLWRLVAKN